MTSAHAVMWVQPVVGAHDTAEVVRWRSPAAARPGPCRRLAVSGDLIATDQTADDAGPLEIADVIYRRRMPAFMPPPTWLGETLDRYPGCAAAVTPAAECRYLIAPRASRPLVFPFYMPNDHALDVLAGAIFLHGWLCAGWPLAGLDPPRLDAAGTLRLAERTALVLVSFRMFYEDSPGPPGVPSSPSRRLMRSASGASMPE